MTEFIGLLLAACVLLWIVCNIAVGVMWLLGWFD
jgi:hypothetical protein